VLKQMLLIGAAAMSFPALAQTTDPASDETPPATQPAPEPTDSAPTDSAQPAPADTPIDSAEPADGNVPTDSAPSDEDGSDDAAPEPQSGA